MIYAHFGLDFNSMIYRDSNGYMVDQTGDGGDGAYREGLFSTFVKGDLESYQYLITHYSKNGLCVRHPKQSPWNNPWNFSRDQLIPYVVGLYSFSKKIGDFSELKKIFYSHAKRFFFCQNFERDVAGSKKYPWPHTFINDRGEKETRNFDFADILLPNSVGVLILCARIYWLYWLLPFCFLFHLLSLYVHSKSKTNEQGQIISECIVYGTLPVYAKLVKDWQELLRNYWVVRRNQEQMYLIISGGVYERLRNNWLAKKIIGYL